MFARRHPLILSLALALAGPAATAAQAPHIAKPRPAPPVPSNMPSLPPAIIDDKLAIGGDDVKARQVQTRLSVDVHINGHGPYHFLVDSGADTSVVGLRIVREVDGALRRAGGALRQSGQEIWPFPPLRNATKRDSKVPR